MRSGLLVLLLACGLHAQEPPAVLELVVGPVPEEGRLAVFRPAFTKQVLVFGVVVVATADTADRKVLHAAHVLAQYLDNNEDGKPDHTAVIANLRVEELPEIFGLQVLLISFRDFREEILFKSIE